MSELLGRALDKLEQKIRAGQDLVVRRGQFAGATGCPTFLVTLETEHQLDAYGGKGDSLESAFVDTANRIEKLELEELERRTIHVTEPVSTITIGRAGSYIVRYTGPVPIVEPPSEAKP